MTVSKRGGSQSIWVKAYWGKRDHATCKTLPRSTQIKKWQDQDHECLGSCAEIVTIDHKQSGYDPNVACDQQVEIAVCYRLYDANYLQLGGSHEGKHEVPAIKSQGGKLEIILLWVYFSDILPRAGSAVSLPTSQGGTTIATRPMDGTLECVDAQD